MESTQQDELVPPHLSQRSAQWQMALLGFAVLGAFSSGGAELTLVIKAEALRHRKCHSSAGDAAEGTSA